MTWHDMTCGYCHVWSPYVGGPAHIFNQQDRIQVILRSLTRTVAHTNNRNGITRFYSYRDFKSPILLNIKLHAPMGRFQLELIYCFTYFSNVVPSKMCVFHSCRPSVVNTTFSTPTRPVENVVLTTKGLQERNIQILDGTTMEN